MYYLPGEAGSTVFFSSINTYIYTLWYCLKLKISGKDKSLFLPVTVGAHIDIISNKLCKKHLKALLSWHIFYSIVHNGNIFFHFRIIFVAKKYYFLFAWNCVPAYQAPLCGSQLHGVAQIILSNICNNLYLFFSYFIISFRTVGK